jgi:hypothetical protein
MIHFSIANILNIINAFSKKASYEGRLCLKCFCASPPAVAPSLLFCCPERKRGVPRHLRASGGHEWAVAPSLLFFVALSEARGSLGAYALREDFTMRCPEGSERCLANARQDRWGVARQDKKGSLAGQMGVLFEESPSSLD